MHREAPRRIEVFQYAAGPGAPPEPSWEGFSAEDPEPVEAPATDQIHAAHQAAIGAVEAGLRTDFEKRLGEETRKAFEAGRERGRLEGRQTERDVQIASQAGAEERRVKQAADLIDNFAQERGRYLHAVEREVVELAMAVAARILRREAQMDPLLLTGAVRVALGQLAGSTQVRLRVPATEIGLWNEAIALLPNLAVKPTVVAGEGMRLGDCEIQTEMGSVDLGIRAQLGEIERGFFDRTGGRRAEDVKPVHGSSVQAGREVHS